jgi:hypothetical protein
MVADQAGNVGIVFNDEDAWFHGIIVNGKRRRVASCQRPGLGFERISSDCNNGAAPMGSVPREMLRFA